MRLIILIIFISISNLNSAFCQTGYLLIATYELKASHKNGMCRDYTMIHEKLNDKSEFEKRRKELMLKHPNSFMTVKLIQPNQAVIVYEFQKEEKVWNCVKKVLTIKVGKDLEYCKNSMDASVKSNPKLYYTKPNSIFERNIISGNKNYEVLENWDGIEVKYIFAKPGTPDEFAAIQIKNPFKDKAAIIGAFKKSGMNQINLGKPVKEITLEPGMFVNFSLKIPDNYILKMEFVKPGKTHEKETGLIDWTKAYIRSQVSKDFLNNKSIQDSINKLRRGAPTGVRG